VVHLQSLHVAMLSDDIYEDVYEGAGGVFCLVGTLHSLFSGPVVPVHLV